MTVMNLYVTFPVFLYLAKRMLFQRLWMGGWMIAPL